MKYFHYYENEEEFANVYDTESYIEPWVSLINDEKKVNYNKMCLSFEIVADGTIKWQANRDIEIEYKTKGAPWTIMPSTLNVEAGQRIKFRGTNDSQLGSFSGSTAQFNVYGNIMSVVNFTTFRTLTTLPAEKMFLGLFCKCQGLLSSKNLILPATTLTNDCYRQMFEDCTSLTNSPMLPADTLASGCYYSMFSGCTSFENAPALPADTLTEMCYYNMFGACSSLTKAPELPAMNLAKQCYDRLFYRCYSLKEPPELPATTMAELCYSSMFHSSGVLRTPTLASTNLAESCYAYMFQNCTGITETTELPTEELLVSGCYHNMFALCKNLETAPALPATALSKYCYWQMFWGCEKLVNAPELPATTLVDYCYQTMFQACINLKYIKCLATDISASDCTKSWVDGVPSSVGVFVKAASMTRWSHGSNGIPTGWTVRSDNE